MIPDQTQIQSIDLKVKSLDNAMNFYADSLGLKEIEANGDTVKLSPNGAEPYMIKLTERRNAPARIGGSPGLYHVAIRFPNRKELARIFLRLFDRKFKFQGFSDHLVSEAIYLSDPEGNGIELYVDKPRSEWIWQNGQIKMESLPLDLSIITNELTDRDSPYGIHPDTDIGHIHLNVSSLFKSEKFYNHLLGFNVTTTDYPGAVFLSAGGYHHHIGTNVWLSRKGIELNEDSIGMEKFTIKIPDIKYIGRVEDDARKNNLMVGRTENGSIEIIDYDKIKMSVVN